MGPQVKIGTHSVRRGTPSVPVAALARGEPLSPLLLRLYPPPSIHPALCPATRRPSLTLIYRAESPRNAPPPHPHPAPLSSLPFAFRPVTNSSLAQPVASLPLRLPPTRLHPFLTPLSPSLINHPYRTPVANLLNYHTFVMSPVRTRDTVLIASP